jgi:flagellar biosynthesis/type III secretory pathway protein FliH
MPIKLEIFQPTSNSEGSQTVVLNMMALEESKLESYEKGYTAGWDDAAAAQTQDHKHASAELARNFQTLDFTYQEARTHVLKAIRPLLNALVGSLLPELARDTLAPTVLETLMPIAESLADAPITLVLNPHARVAVEVMLKNATGLPLQIIEESSLGEGQVFLRVGDTETEVNLERAIAEISLAVQNFFELPERS